jgi:hypothetical protein
MKANVMMKALSAAVLGLAFSGSVMAACGTDPSVAGGGQWDLRIQTDGTAVISTGGANTTECGMSSSLASTAGSLAQAVVRDDTPENEPRYRAQFWINADALSGTFGGLQSVQLFQVQGPAGTPPSGSRQMMRALLLPGGAANRQIRFQLAVNTPPNFRVQGALIPLTAGWNRVQVDLVTGASGSLKIWVNNGTEGTPTQTLTGDNAGWVGVDRALMGLAAPAPEFVTEQNGRVVKFDEFDSRRQTFIN